MAIDISHKSIAHNNFVKDETTDVCRWFFVVARGFGCFSEYSRWLFVETCLDGFLVHTPAWVRVQNPLVHLRWARGVAFRTWKILRCNRNKFRKFRNGSKMNFFKQRSSTQMKFRTSLCGAFFTGYCE